MPCGDCKIQELRVKGCGSVKDWVRTSNSALVTYQVRTLISPKMLVENRVETARLVNVTIHTVLDALRSIATEVI